MRGRRYKIDIMRSLGLEVEHQPGKRPGLPFLSDHRMVDRVILAKQAIQVAAAKKDCTRAACSANGRFFPKMERCPSDDWTGAGAAKTCCFAPVHFAGTWTKCTSAHFHFTWLSRRAACSFFPESFFVFSCSELSIIS